MEIFIKSDTNSVFFRCVQDSNEAIMISDIRGRLVYVNPAWSKIYGYEFESAVGQTPRLLHSGLHSDDFYREMWTRISNPEIASWKGELVNRAKDGSLVPVMLSITPFRDSNGQVSGYMGIALDMTERRELEAKIAHQDRLASIGMLASGLAHEIGTPLGVIRGRAELMGMQFENAEAQKGFEIITSQIDRISKLIRSLLRLSRNFSTAHLETVKVRGIADDILALLSQNFTKLNIKIQNEIPIDTEVLADPERLSQILLNLSINAAQAMEARGSLPDGQSHSFIFSCLPEEEGYITVSVTDTGTGISKENLKKLFKPFFTTKGVGEGTGLGLAISSQLMREMEGEISVSSEVNRGAQFYLKLRRVPHLPHR
jgi:PAS domain S-box-containing protein